MHTCTHAYTPNSFSLGLFLLSFLTPRDIARSAEGLPRRPLPKLGYKVPGEFDGSASFDVRCNLLVDTSIGVGCEGTSRIVDLGMLDTLGVEWSVEIELT